MIRYMRFVKTGSSTLTDHLSEHGIGCQFRMYKGEQEIKMIYGHDLIYDDSVGGQWMTIIRNPAAWHVSVYNHHCSRIVQPPDFWRWYESGAIDTVRPVGSVRNKMTAYARRLFGNSTVDGIKKVLNACWFVGITGQLDKDLPKLFKLLGAPVKYDNRRVAGEYDIHEKKHIPIKQELTDEIRDRIRDDNPLDYEIYEYAVQCREETLINLEALDA